MLDFLDTCMIQKLSHQYNAILMQASWAGLCSSTVTPAWYSFLGLFGLVTSWEFSASWSGKPTLEKPSCTSSSTPASVQVSELCAVISSRWLNPILKSWSPFSNPSHLPPQFPICCLTHLGFRNITSARVISNFWISNTTPSCVIYSTILKLYALWIDNPNENLKKKERIIGWDRKSVV